jgi:sortase A
VKVTVRKQPLRQILKWSQRVLFTCAILLLGYCAFALTDAWLFQRRASRDLDRLLRDRRAAAAAAPRAEPTAAPEPNAVPKPASAAVAGGLIGRIEIPRLRLSEVVVEGVDQTSLRRAVGHIPGTAIPGQDGNVGLAGHRDTFFSPLKDLKINDEVQISTLKGLFKYEVVSLRIVDPENVGVLAPSAENVLTLVTCYPFYFVGPAPKRWIVRARQVSSQAVASSNVK